MSATLQTIADASEVNTRCAVANFATIRRMVLALPVSYQIDLVREVGASRFWESARDNIESGCDEAAEDLRLDTLANDEPGVRHERWEMRA